MAFARFNAAENKIDAVGCFTEKEYGRFFEYKHNPNPVTLPRGNRRPSQRPFDSLIYVGPNGEETRMALILGSVAYVIVDETDDGELVVEKWTIKNHRIYR